jgi:hypothetical protein
MKQLLSVLIITLFLLVGITQCVNNEVHNKRVLLTENFYSFSKSEEINENLITNRDGNKKGIMSLELDNYEIDSCKTTVRLIYIRNELAGLTIKVSADFSQNFLDKYIPLLNRTEVFINAYSGSCDFGELDYEKFPSMCYNFVDEQVIYKHGYTKEYIFKKKNIRYYGD